MANEPADKAIQCLTLWGLVCRGTKIQCPMWSPTRCHQDWLYRNCHFEDSGVVGNHETSCCRRRRQRCTILARNSTAKKNSSPICDPPAQNQAEVNIQTKRSIPEVTYLIARSSCGWCVGFADVTRDPAWIWRICDANVTRKIPVWCTSYIYK
jgi:hypothetical protein